ncbi:Kae1-associated kinase Bud32 [Necator americanus]|uniref:non-specific serine/threonine protein kinase n=1 Tax=Necator americanus TaxID=51031 RepID=W2SPS2_NECAM|nr:Kae1-associated kinase Bud32 [Necator americanus]ETN70846.1 Kae1-associated kinase Bud32 [Necator americanus]
MDFENQEFESGFHYEIQNDGMRQGAEARIHMCTYLGKPAIMKERFVKKYRHSALDHRLNKVRMRNELKGMVKAQESDNMEFGNALGEAIAKMHLGNLVHGDLTTSNVLPEDKGVDLYVLERAMISTHIDSEQVFESVLEGYRSFNNKQGDAVLKKLDEIRLRGRKRDMTG